MRIASSRIAEPERRQRASPTLIRLGHPNVAIYNAGLMEWCADRTLPLELGE